MQTRGLPFIATDVRQRNDTSIITLKLFDFSGRPSFL